MSKAAAVEAANRINRICKAKKELRIGGECVWNIEISLVSRDSGGSIFGNDCNFFSIDFNVQFSGLFLSFTDIAIPFQKALFLTWREPCLFGL